MRRGRELANNAQVQRISVVGNSGSGKTTLAASLAAALDVPHLELDAIYHLPGWQPLAGGGVPGPVADFITGDAWVVDGNYSKVRDLVWRRADTVVWLDPPRPAVMRQLMGRTLSRMARRTELWNGNRESCMNLFRPTRRSPSCAGPGPSTTSTATGTRRRGTTRPTPT